MKALARKLRDWLNGFLEEPGDLVAGARPETIGPEAATATTPSEQEQEIDTPAWTTLSQQGPPEDWLRRVREAAPGLLLPADESGMPRFKESVRGGIGERQSQHEKSSRLAATVQSAEAYASAQTSPANPPSGKKTWVQDLKSDFIDAFARRAEKDRYPREENSAPHRQAQRPVVFAGSRPEFAEDVRTSETTQEVATNLQHQSGPQIRRAAKVAPSWTERVKQRIHEVLRTLADGSSFATPSVAVKAQGPSPRFAATHNEAAATAGRIGTKMDREPSNPAPTFRASERPSTPETHSPSKHRWAVKDFPSSTVNDRTWTPLPTEAHDFANRIRETASTTTGRERSSPRADDLRTTQLVGQAAWNQTPESERVDPWPELPDDQSISTSELAQLLRSAERLRTLDLEQRGGR